MSDINEGVKNYIDGIQTVQILKAYIASIPEIIIDPIYAHKIAAYATDKLNRLLLK